jgi:lysophospholipase L1-like esterase
MLPLPTRLLLLVALLLVVGCNRNRWPLTNAPPRATTIACFGDSLVAGVGAPAGESYPAQLAKRLDRPVAAHGKSGDTTADALPKAAGVAQRGYGIIVVTLGGNDILQRVQWSETERNLRQLFRDLQQGGAVVVFTGVTGPLNPSRNRLYRDLCREAGVLYIPEILDGILNNTDLKADEVHPNARGYQLMAERVATALQQAGLLGVQ